MRNLIYSWVLLLGVFLCFSSCEKDLLNEDGGIKPTNVLTERSSNPGVLERAAPDFGKLSALGTLVEDNLSAEEYLNIVDFYGDVYWNQGNLIGSTSETGAYIMSVPLIKNDSVKAIIFNANIGGNQYVTFLDGKDLNLPVVDLLDRYSSGQLVLMASSLSNHQYYQDGSKVLFLHYFTKPFS